MAKVELGTVIAERVLQSARLKKDVRIRIGCPRQMPTDEFITPYQIIGAGDQKVRWAAGVDAIQSLQLAFRSIGADVHDGLKDCGLTWLGSDDLGLPRH